jgi:hypothetical protein
MNSFVQLPGQGKYPRAIRELQREVGLIRPGFVPGARVSHTARGVVIEPDGTTGNTNAPRRLPSSAPRWG